MLPSKAKHSTEITRDLLIPWALYPSDYRLLNVSVYTSVTDCESTALASAELQNSGVEFNQNNHIFISIVSGLTHLYQLLICLAKFNRSLIAKFFSNGLQYTCEESSMKLFLRTYERYVYHGTKSARVYITWKISSVRKWPAFVHVINSSKLMTLNPCVSWIEIAACISNKMPARRHT